MQRGRVGRGHRERERAVSNIFEPGEEYIAPSMLDSRVVPAVAAAVSEVAARMRVARRRPRAG